MPEQNYANHRRYVPMYHIVTFGLIVLSLIGSIVNLIKSLGQHAGLYSASLLVVVFIVLASALCLRAQLCSESSGPRHPRRGKPASFCDDRQIARPTPDHPADHRPAICLGRRISRTLQTRDRRKPLRGCYQEGGQKLARRLLSGLAVLRHRSKPVCKRSLLWDGSPNGCFPLCRHFDNIKADNCDRTSPYSTSNAI